MISSLIECPGYGIHPLIFHSSGGVKVVMVWLTGSGSYITRLFGTSELGRELPTPIVGRIIIIAEHTVYLSCTLVSRGSIWWVYLYFWLSFNILCSTLNNSHVHISISISICVYPFHIIYSSVFLFIKSIEASICSSKILKSTATTSPSIPPSHLASAFQSRPLESDRYTR